jgi:DtxR family transcriptional regulator, Mn-dependent transcriptional regulator
MLTRSMDEYLKAIYTLTQSHEYAKTSEIAKLLSVYPSSVTEMLGKLADQKLVEHHRYHGAKLTSFGKKTAKQTIRKYRLLQVFFQKFLGLSKEEASDQACLMEHHISDKAEERICTMLDRPKESFDDKPIPKCGKKISCEKCLATALHSKE